jgi:Zn-dependent protease
MLIQILFENPTFFFLIAISLVISITVHEFAHALVAYKLGDSTPKIQGRVTLNPASHLDLFGTIALLFLGFGWGKPVEFDIYNLKHPKRDTALIAFAGPLINIFFGCLFFFLSVISPNLVVLEFVAYINFILAFFNLIPIHPLDGFNIVTGLLPYNLAYKWRDLSDYGIFLLLAFVISGASSYTIVPLANFTMQGLSYLTNLFI